MTSRDLRWPEVNRKWRNLTGITWKWLKKAKNLLYCTFCFLQGCSWQEEAVTLQEMTSRHLRWQEVTQSRRNLTRSHQKVAVEGQNFPYTVLFTSCKAVARRRRPSRDRKWRHVTTGDLKWPGSYVIWPKVTWKWL